MSMSHHMHSQTNAVSDSDMTQDMNCCDSGDMSSCCEGDCQCITFVSSGAQIPVDPSAVLSKSGEHALPSMIFHVIAPFSVLPKRPPILSIS